MKALCSCFRAEILKENRERCSQGIAVCFYHILYMETIAPACCTYHRQGIMPGCFKYLFITFPASFPGEVQFPEFVGAQHVNPAQIK